MADKWEVDGGGNDDNQAHGPLIDMVDAAALLHVTMSRGSQVDDELGGWSRYGWFKYGERHGVKMKSRDSLSRPSNNNERKTKDMD